MRWGLQRKETFWRQLEEWKSLEAGEEEAEDNVEEGD